MPAQQSAFVLNCFASHFRHAPALSKKIAGVAGRDFDRGAAAENMDLPVIPPTLSQQLSHSLADMPQVITLICGRKCQPMMAPSVVGWLVAINARLRFS